MKVAEMIQQLESMDADAEVRLAFQPNWPMQYRLDAIVEVDLTIEAECPICDGIGEIEEVVVKLDGDEVGEMRACVRCDGSGEIEDETGERIVFIGEGGQFSDEPYLPGAAARELGWKS